VPSAIGGITFHAGTVCAAGIQRQFTVVTPLSVAWAATPTMGFLPEPAVFVSFT